MAAEAMVRHGHSDLVGPWLDGYMRRLEEFPRGWARSGPTCRRRFGDLRRVADWTSFFRAELGQRPWREVLNATHGLAYWAARWQTLPGGHAGASAAAAASRARAATPLDSLAAIPRIAEQAGRPHWLLNGSR